MSVTFLVPGFGFAVGNALKFTHNGSVTVSVKVAAQQTAMPFNADDGNDGDLSWGIMQFISLTPKGPRSQNWTHVVFSS